jgi:hypothetical protein
MNELCYVKLRACYAPDLAIRSKKVVGGEDRQTSAGVALARFMTIRADKASQMEKIS